MVAARLNVNPDGRIAGKAKLQYNNPFPCVNGNYGSGGMMGTVMHTMVGDLPGTIAVFNNSNYQASAHFGIAQDGLIHQFGPVGKGWCAWAQVAGNDSWYSIEHADGGNPDTPLTAAQITASAQLVECLSAFAGFPLQISDSPSVKGYGAHFMGGAGWGGHTCPDLPPKHVRSAQRAVILSEAAAIRNPPAAPPAQPSKGTTDMIIVQVDKTDVPAGTDWPGVFLLASDATLHHITSTPDENAYKAAGVPGPVVISWAEYEARTAA